MATLRRRAQRAEAELFYYFIPNLMDPTLHIWTKVDNEEYDAVSYNVVKRFDDGDITIHEFVNGAFEPAKQVNAKHTELLGTVFISAIGAPIQSHIGTVVGGENNYYSWNVKGKKMF